MSGRNLVGWNGCREKRFRAAFWFKLTELIFTGHSNDRASILCPGPGHPLRISLSDSDPCSTREKEFFYWQTQSGVLI
jgi:hypothetical protein